MPPKGHTRYQPPLAKDPNHPGHSINPNVPIGVIDSLVAEFSPKPIGKNKPVRALSLQILSFYFQTENGGYASLVEWFNSKEGTMQWNPPHTAGDNRDTRLVRIVFAILGGSQKYADVADGGEENKFNELRNLLRVPFDEAAYDFFFKDDNTGMKGLRGPKRTRAMHNLRYNLLEMKRVQDLLDNETATDAFIAKLNGQNTKEISIESLAAYLCENIFGVTTFSESSSAFTQFSGLAKNVYPKREGAPVAPLDSWGDIVALVENDADSRIDGVWNTWAESLPSPTKLDIYMKLASDRIGALIENQHRADDHFDGAGAFIASIPMEWQSTVIAMDNGTNDDEDKEKAVSAVQQVQAAIRSIRLHRERDNNTGTRVINAVDAIEKKTLIIYYKTTRAIFKLEYPSIVEASEDNNEALRNIFVFGCELQYMMDDKETEDALRNFIKGNFDDAQARGVFGMIFPEAVLPSKENAKKELSVQIAEKRAADDAKIQDQVRAAYDQGINKFSSMEYGVQEEALMAYVVGGTGAQGSTDTQRAGVMRTLKNAGAVKDFYTKLSDNMKSSFNDGTGLADFNAKLIGKVNRGGGTVDDDVTDALAAILILRHALDKEDTTAVTETSIDDMTSALHAAQREMAATPALRKLVLERLPFRSEQYMLLLSMHELLKALPALAEASERVLKEYLGFMKEAVVARFPSPDQVEELREHLDGIIATLSHREYGGVGLLAFIDEELGSNVDVDADADADAGPPSRSPSPEQNPYLERYLDALEELNNKHLPEETGAPGRLLRKERFKRLKKDVELVFENEQEIEGLSDEMMKLLTGGKRVRDLINEWEARREAEAAPPVKTGKTWTQAEPSDNAGKLLAALERGYAIEKACQRLVDEAVARGEDPEDLDAKVLAAALVKLVEPSTDGDGGTPKVDEQLAAEVAEVAEVVADVLKSTRHLLALKTEVRIAMTNLYADKGQLPADFDLDGFVEMVMANHVGVFDLDDEKEDTIEALVSEFIEIQERLHRECRSYMQSEYGPVLASGELPDTFDMPAFVAGLVELLGRPLTEEEEPMIGGVVAAIVADAREKRLETLARRIWTAITDANPEMMPNTVALKPLPDASITMITADIGDLTTLERMQVGKLVEAQMKTKWPATEDDTAAPEKPLAGALEMICADVLKITDDERKAEEEKERLAKEAERLAKEAEEEAEKERLRLAKEAEAEAEEEKERVRAEKEAEAERLAEEAKAEKEEEEVKRILAKQKEEAEAEEAATTARDLLRVYASNFYYSVSVTIFKRTEDELDAHIVRLTELACARIDSTQWADFEKWMIRWGVTQGARFAILFKEALHSLPLYVSVPPVVGGRLAGGGAVFADIPYSVSVTVVKMRQDGRDDELPRTVEVACSQINNGLWKPLGNIQRSVIARPPRYTKAINKAIAAYDEMAAPV